jgi:hypothetical protein
MTGNPPSGVGDNDGRFRNRKDSFRQNQGWCYGHRPPHIYFVTIASYEFRGKLQFRLTFEWVKS